MEILNSIWRGIVQTHTIEKSRVETQTTIISYPMNYKCEDKTCLTCFIETNKMKIFTANMEEYAIMESCGEKYVATLRIIGETNKGKPDCVLIPPVGKVLAVLKKDVSHKYRWKFPVGGFLRLSKDNQIILPSGNSKVENIDLYVILRRDVETLRSEYENKIEKIEVRLKNITEIMGVVTIED